MMSFDDIDARPGSVASRLRTLVGLYLRRLDGWVSSADLVHLMADLGVGDAQARTGIARLKSAGLLLPQRRESSGYQLNPDAEAMLARGDRRIFASHPMTAQERWCLLSFSIPEARRSSRNQLRRQLQWLGCGTVAPALWIHRATAAPEIELTLGELDLRGHATLFTTDEPDTSGALCDAVARWWDFDAIRLEHEACLAAAGTFESDAPFRRYVDGVDAWRVVPYADPGLPPALMPPGWIGELSAQVFAERRAQDEDAAWAHVQRVVGLRLQ